LEDRPVLAWVLRVAIHPTLLGVHVVVEPPRVGDDIELGTLSAVGSRDHYAPRDHDVRLLDVDGAIESGRDVLGERILVVDLHVADLLAEQATHLVDLVDRQVRPVAQLLAGGGDEARQRKDADDLDLSAPGGTGRGLAGAGPPFSRGVAWAGPPPA